MKKQKDGNSADGAALARLSATIDADTLQKAQLIAQVCGYRFSFSRFVNDVLAREVQARSDLLKIHP